MSKASAVNVNLCSSTSVHKPTYMYLTLSFIACINTKKRINKNKTAYSVNTHSISIGYIIASSNSRS